MKVSFFKGLQVVAYLNEEIPEIVKDKRVTLEEALRVITTVFAMLGVNVLEVGVKIR